jgi:hypothetical protein
MVIARAGHIYINTIKVGKSEDLTGSGASRYLQVALTSYV